MQTAGELVVAIQEVMHRHGALIPLYFMDPETGKRYDVQVTTGIGAAPEGVYVALVVASPVGR